MKDREDENFIQDLRVTLKFYLYWFHISYHQFSILTNSTKLLLECLHPVLKPAILSICWVFSPEPLKVTVLAISCGINSSVLWKENEQLSVGDKNNFVVLYWITWWRWMFFFWPLQIIAQSFSGRKYMPETILTVKLLQTGSSNLSRIKKLTC